MHIHGFYIIPILIFHAQRTGVTFYPCQYIYLSVYMVEVKGGRGKYIEVFFIFGRGEYIYFLALGMFVGATLSQMLIRKDWLNNMRVYAA